MASNRGAQGDSFVGLTGNKVFFSIMHSRGKHALIISNLQNEIAFWSADKSTFNHPFPDKSTSK